MIRLNLNCASPRYTNADLRSIFPFYNPLGISLHFERTESSISRTFQFGLTEFLTWLCASLRIVTKAMGNYDINYRTLSSGNRASLNDLHFSEQTTGRIPPLSFTFSSMDWNELVVPLFTVFGCMIVMIDVSTCSEILYLKVLLLAVLVSSFLRELCAPLMILSSSNLAITKPDN